MSATMNDPNNNDPKRARWRPPPPKRWTRPARPAQQLCWTARATHRAMEGWQPVASEQDWLRIIEEDQASSDQWAWSDQELLLHPQKPRRVRLRDDRAVDDDVLRDATGVRPSRGGHAGHDGATVDPARGVAHRRVHAPVDDRLDRWRHRVDSADQDLGAPVRLHDTGRGERHVVVVEERGIDLRVSVEIALPQLRGFRDVPVRRIGRQHLDVGDPLDDRPEPARASLRAAVPE